MVVRILFRKFQSQAEGPLSHRRNQLESYLESFKGYLKKFLSVPTVG